METDKKKLAEERFQVIQKAYEGNNRESKLSSCNSLLVLSDPQKRVIYDTYGEEGLTATWEVGPRYKTTEQVRNNMLHTGY